MYAKLESYDKAINNYDEAIKINPAYTSAFNNRGNSYSELGNYNNAIEDFTRAIKIEPDNGQTYYNLAIAKQRAKVEFCSDYKKSCDLGYNQGCDDYDKLCK